jgi:Na+/serine symporter
MDTSSYVTFLLIGILLVLIDGQILYRGGLGYLQKVYPSDSARSVMQLVTVLFHLAVLGVLALISTLNVATGMPIRDLVVKWGVVLLGRRATRGRDGW